MTNLPFFIYLLLFLVLLHKDLRLPLLDKTDRRLPLLMEEKVAIKNYYGVGNLAGATNDYRDRVLTDVLASLPLLLFSLAFSQSLLLVSLPLVFWAYRFRYLKMTKKIRSWRIDFYKKYPGFLNDLKMYLQSGLTLENSLNLYFEKETDCHYLEQLRLSINKINFGKSRREAFLEVINQTREREMIHLMNYFIHLIRNSTIK